MNDLDEIWEYVEPHESGGTCYIRMTKQQAINWMKKYIEDFLQSKGVVRHLSDEELFDQWVVVHWATKYEESK